jgi:hypothetical protein
MPLACFLSATKLKNCFPCFTTGTEAEFLKVIAVHSHLYYGFKSGLKLICNVNIVYGYLKSEKSQDYAQKPQRN